MITEFFIYSRYGVEAMQPHEVPHVIVSITTPGDPKPEAKIRMNEHTLGIERFVFTDLDRHTEQGTILCKESDLIQVEDARRILALVSAHPEAQRLIVHCDAGLSRSPAVAAALSKILTGDDAEYFRRYHPNMLVYRRILGEHYAGEHADGNGNH